MKRVLDAEATTAHVLKRRGIFQRMNPVSLRVSGSRSQPKGVELLYIKTRSNEVVY
jgi:hypothetical protein